MSLALLLPRRHEALEFLEPGSKNPSINSSTGSSISPFRASDSLPNADTIFITFRELFLWLLHWNEPLKLF